MATESTQSQNKMHPTHVEKKKHLVLSFDLVSLHRPQNNLSQTLFPPRMDPINRRNLHACPVISAYRPTAEKCFQFCTFEQSRPRVTSHSIADCHQIWVTNTVIRGNSNCSYCFNLSFFGPKHQESSSISHQHCYNTKRDLW